MSTPSSSTTPLSEEGPPAPQDPQLGETGAGNGTEAGTDATETTVQHECTLPAAGPGMVSTAFGNIAPEEHRKRAGQLYSFLRDPNANLMRLNTDRTLRTCLVAIPSSKLVKVVYGLSFGVTGIETVSPLADKMLVLFGEGGGEFGTPQVLVMDKTVCTHHDVISMSDPTFQQHLMEKGRDYSYPLAAAQNVTDQPVSMMQLAPILAHLVLDGFSTHLDAAVVYERIQSCADHDEALLHASAFLRSVLLSFRIPHNKPYTTSETFMNMPPTAARTWASFRFGELLPQALPTPAEQNGFQGALPLLLEQFARTQQKQQPQGETAKEDTIMSEYELRLTYKLCGLQPGESCVDHLPQWFREVSDKKLTDHAKNMIITNAINTMIRFEDAEVPITPSLLKMIRKRDWTGHDTGKFPAYSNATKGLSPFALIELSNDEVATMMSEYDALDKATSTTAAEYKKVTTSTPKIPDTAEDFLDMIMRFTNLLGALLGGMCPLYRHLIEIVTDLKDYSKQARQSMSLQTKGSILWVILVQARHFSKGETSVKPEFLNLKDSLCSEFRYGMVPNSLLSKSEKENPWKKMITTCKLIRGTRN